ncbi:hypothetical protein F4604DRAFT_265179 [Suillus subluteus]|nr:hypothetical protein F4604DRAFT_265179 [Suillus subluteus]
MCSADVTMITCDSIQGHDIPYPNFNTHHQCRNYEKIGLTSTLFISINPKLLASKIRFTSPYPSIR